MRAMTRVKAVVAASMALGLALVAAPAFAAPGDFETSLTNVNEAVTAGSPIGIGITVSGVPADIEDVFIGLSMQTGPASGDNGAVTQAENNFDGTFSAYVWDGDVIAQLPDSDGFPAYSAYAYYDATPGDEDTRVYTDISVDIPVVEALQLSVTSTQFTTAGWGSGISFTVGNVPEDVDEVLVLISASSGGSGGIAAEVTVQRNADGKFVGTLAPTEAPKVTAENGWQYFAYASALRVADDQNSWVGSNAVELTVVAAATTAPVKPVRVESGV